MGGLFSSPRAPAPPPQLEAGITRREKEADEARDRERRRASERRRQRMQLGSAIPEELLAPGEVQTTTTLGPRQNPQ